MFSFLSKPIAGARYWEGLYLLFAFYLLTHPPLAYPQTFAVALGGGLVLLLFRSVPSENFHTIGLFGFLFLLYSLASTFWSAAPGASLRSDGVLFLAALLYLMGRQNTLQSKNRIEMFFLLFALAAALIGLHQWFFGFDQLAQLLPQYSGVEADQLNAAVHNKRAFGPLVTSGALAALLIFTLPQLLVRCWTASGFKRVLFMLAALILLAGLAATGGVGAWVCLGLVLGLLLYRQGAKTWVLGLAGLLALILGALLWYRGFHSWALASYSMRLELWRSAWVLFLKKPWFGWGLGAFGEAYQSVGLPLDSGALFAHDLPLQLLVETGLAGTLLAAAALLSFVLRFKWPARWEGWGVMGGLFSVSLFSLIDLPFQMTELVWVFAGVAARLELKPEKGWKIPKLPVSYVPWVILVVLTVTGFWPPYRPWNFALLAVCLWTAFALLEAQIESMTFCVGLGAFYLALRAFIHLPKVEAVKPRKIQVQPK